MYLLSYGVMENSKVTSGEEITKGAITSATRDENLPAKMCNSHWREQGKKARNAPKIN